MCDIRVLPGDWRRLDGAKMGILSRRAGLHPK